MDPPPRWAMPHPAIGAFPKTDAGTTERQGPPAGGEALSRQVPLPGHAPAAGVTEEQVQGGAEGAPA